MGLGKVSQGPAQYEQRDGGTQVLDKSTRFQWSQWVHGIFGTHKVDGESLYQPHQSSFITAHLLTSQVVKVMETVHHF